MDKNGRIEMEKNGMNWTKMKKNGLKWIELARF